MYKNQPALRQLLVLRVARQLTGEPNHGEPVFLPGKRGEYRMRQ